MYSQRNEQHATLSFEFIAMGLAACIKHWKGSHFCYSADV